MAWELHNGWHRFYKYYFLEAIVNNNRIINSKFFIGVIAATFAVAVPVVHSQELWESRLNDGNDFATNPGVGAFGAPIERETDKKGMAPRYTDGSTPNYNSFPNPRVVSNELFDLKSDLTDPRGVTDYSVFWGQFLAHDISSTLTEASEPMAITVPDGDPDFPVGSFIGLFRSTSVDGTGDSMSNPRKSINGVSSFIDASMIYGTGDRADQIRTFAGGRLLTSEHALLPFENGGPSFLAGDSRVNENFALIALHTLFVREHNRYADLIHLKRPEWTDGQIYLAARLIVSAEIQAVTYNEYLPSLGISLKAYTGFKESVAANGIAEVLTTGFRLGHTQTPPLRLFMDESGNKDFVPLLATFFNPGGFNGHMLNNILRGGAFMKAQKVDLQMIDDLRNLSLFGGAVLLDLAAMDIQRSRDRGILDYNSVRVAFGLKKVKDFKSITKNKSVQKKLQTLYGNVNNIDLFAGMLAEDPLKNSSVGPTINAMLKMQFERLRDGDRFFYKNDPALKTGAIAQLGYGLPWIETRTMSDIIRDNTSVTDREIPLFVFKTMNNKERYAAYNERIAAAAAALKFQTKDWDALLAQYKKQRNRGGIAFATAKINEINSFLNPYKARLATFPKK